MQGTKHLGTSIWQIVVWYKYAEISDDPQEWIRQNVGTLIPDYEEVKKSRFEILYFVDRASRHKFLLITNLMHFLVYLFIHLISLHVSSIKCSSSGDRIVLIHHLVWLVCASDFFVCLTGISSSHLHRLIIPNDVVIQFDLLMMSTWCSKHVERWNE
jgi:hypothetical protein